MAGRQQQIVAAATTLAHPPTQKIITTTCGSVAATATIPPPPALQLQQPPQVKRGRPRRSTMDSISSYSGGTLLGLPPKGGDGGKMDAAKSLSLDVGEQRKPCAGRVPTSADSCSTIANFLMTFNKVGFWEKRREADVWEKRKN
jgi:hypothetical protein